MTLSGGYGSGGWGSMGYGGPSLLGTPLALSDVAAVRENTFRLLFSLPIEWSMIGDVRDGSIVSHYSVTAVSGTFGDDSLPARAVRAVAVSLTPEDQLDVPADYGRYVDLVVDRPMSPYPARYTVSFAGLYAVGSSTVMAGSRDAVAVYRGRLPPLPEFLVSGADIANPQTLNSFYDPLPNPNEQFLGTFTYDDNGDYAADEGMVALHKRVLRRIITRKGAFSFLPDYGVGVPAEAKRLNDSTTRGRIAEEVARQVSLEPEVEKCVCRIEPDTTRPGLVRFKVLVRTRQGQAVKINVPFVTV